MHVDTEGVVLFMHIALVIVSFMMATVLPTSLLQMRRTERSSDLALWAPLIRRLEPLSPESALLLLGAGAWLVHLSDGFAHAATELANGRWRTVVWRST